MPFIILYSNCKSVILIAIWISYQVFIYELLQWKHLKKKTLSVKKKEFCFFINKNTVYKIKKKLQLKNCFFNTSSDVLNTDTKI